MIFADVYDLLTSIFTIGSILQALLVPPRFSKIKFTVTKKDFAKTKTSYKYITVTTLLFIIVIAAEMQGIYDLLYSEVYSVLAVVANLFWNSINIVILFFALKVVIEKPEKRGYQRVREEEEIVLEDTEHHKHNTQLYDISRSGASFTSAEDLDNKLHEDFKMDINGIPTFIKLLNSKKIGNKHLYKSIFRKPITLLKLTKRKLNRLERYVRLAYKNPEMWDDFLKKLKK